MFARVRTRSLADRRLGRLNGLAGSQTPTEQNPGNAEERPGAEQRGVCAVQPLRAACCLSPACRAPAPARERQKRGNVVTVAQSQFPAKRKARLKTGVRPPPLAVGHFGAAARGRDMSLGQKHETRGHTPLASEICRRSFEK